MTDEQLLPVEQADRDAAAALWFVTAEATDENFAVGHHLRTGKADHNDMVQAFARHRIAVAPVAGLLPTLIYAREMLALRGVVSDEIDEAIAAHRLASTPTALPGAEDVALREVIAAKLLGSVNAPEQEIYRISGEIAALQRPRASDEVPANPVGEGLVEALNKALYLAVSTLAFHGRDRGTPRQDQMLDGLEKVALETDQIIRAALAGKSAPTASSQEQGASGEVAK